MTGWIVVETGVNAWESSSDHKLLGGTRYEIPGSQRDLPFPNVGLDLLDLLTT